MSRLIISYSIILALAFFTLSAQAARSFDNIVWKENTYIAKEDKNTYLEMILLFNYDNTRFTGLIRGYGNLKECELTFDGKASNKKNPIYGRARRDGFTFLNGVKVGFPWSYISLDKRGDRVFVKTEVRGKDHPLDSFCNTYDEKPFPKPLSAEIVFDSQQ